jgi:hypothetical protein
MREAPRDRDFLGVRDLREKLSSVSVSFNFPSSDEQ